MPDGDDIQAGDRVLFRKGGKVFEGVIKSIRGDKIEIDDSTVKEVPCAKNS